MSGRGHPSFFNNRTTRRRGKRRRGDLGGDQHGLFGHGTAALGERHRAAAAVLRVADRGEEPARGQPVDHALVSGGIEIDVAAEMVRNWVCARPSIMRVMKIAVWRCMATRSRKPTWSSST